MDIVIQLDIPADLIIFLQHDITLNALVFMVENSLSFPVLIERRYVKYAQALNYVNFNCVLKLGFWN